MSMEIRVEGHGLLLVRINRIWRRAEFDEMQRAAAKIIGEVGKVAALILLDEFQGWQRGDEWGDVSFLVEHGSDIVKIAIVGEERWRDEALMFAAADLRPGRVRFFNDVDSARAWLAEPTAREPG